MRKALDACHRFSGCLRLDLLDIYYEKTHERVASLDDLNKRANGEKLLHPDFDMNGENKNDEGWKKFEITLE